MAKTESTLLRFLAGTDPLAISLTISMLPFKVEIKGGPVQSAAGKWFVWFVIPDYAPKDFGNVELE